MRERARAAWRSPAGPAEPRCQVGASLIELLVSLGLIAVVILPVLATLATSGIVAGRFTRSGEDAILARSQIESILRQQYRAAGATPYATIAPFSGFTIGITVTPVISYTYPTPVSPTATIAPLTDTVQTATVTITLPDGSGSYDLSTIKADRKLR